MTNFDVRNSLQMKRTAQLDIRFALKAPGAIPTKEAIYRTEVGKTKKRCRDYKKEDGGRSIQEQWFIENQWLRVPRKDHQHRLFCNICSVVSGTLTSFEIKSHAIKQHGNTSKHKHAVEKYVEGEFDEEASEETKRVLKAVDQNNRPSKKLETVFQEGTPIALQREFRRKEIQFRLVFGILKHFRPMMDYL